MWQESISAPTDNKLYCAWIRANDDAGTPLVCVWIEPQMRGEQNDSHSAVETQPESQI